MDQRVIAPYLACEEICRISAVSPESVALSCESATMSYKELERRSSLFAGYLAKIGVSPGSTVAICLERSFDWIVAALGILRSGSAYVPLDSGWSAERLSFAIRDSGAALLVGSTKLLNNLVLTIPGIDPTRDASKIEDASRCIDTPLRPTSLAYVIYTSGSTGFPKGVEITHGNLAHLVAWHRGEFSLTQHDRISHIAGLGFDAAVWEIWPTLAAGATLCLPDDTVRSSPDLLQNWLVAERVTISFVPTVLAKSMITATWPEESCLRFLLTGGDVLHRGPVEGLPFKVSNNYGPTECTVVATSGLVAPGHDSTPSIGREIKGTSIYLLDQQGQPVADGFSGEIYIGGNGVGRGYRNLPELTQQFFLPDPFANSSDARMYRTGDLAIRQSDGILHFRGRVDRQVKIRGQRVELDEISSILGRHPEVTFATATVIPSVDGDNELVAYILPRRQAVVPTMTTLQKHLLKSIPQYMVPSIFVRLHSLPLSLNGKIDLTLLKYPNGEDVLRGETARAPETPVEEKVLSILQELLESTAVTLDDDFFLVGGHSLIGMQLVLRLREAFGVQITLKQLFQAPTASRLASVVESALFEVIANLSDEETGFQLAE